MVDMELHSLYPVRESPADAYAAGLAALVARADPHSYAEPVGEDLGAVLVRARRRAAHAAVGVAEAVRRAHHA